MLQFELVNFLLLQYCHQSVQKCLIPKSIMYYQFWLQPCDQYQQILASNL